MYNNCVLLNIRSMYHCNLDDGGGSRLDTVWHSNLPILSVDPVRKYKDNLV